jgi:hypothetical protein
MFDDKPDNQPIHYIKRGLSNNVGLDPCCFFVVSKFQMETKTIGVRNKRTKKFTIA